LTRFAIQQLREFQNLRRLGHACFDVGLGHLGDLQTVGHVVEHAHVRIQGVVLKHHGDVALGRLQLIDNFAANRNLAARDFFQARHHAQQGAFAAAGGAHDHDELTVGNLGVHAVDDLVALGAVAVGFFDVAQGDGGHGS
jgi:hypothetical protein